MSNSFKAAGRSVKRTTLWTVGLGPYCIQGTVDCWVSQVHFKTIRYILTFPIFDKLYLENAWWYQKFGWQRYVITVYMYRALWPAERSNSF